MWKKENARALLVEMQIYTYILIWGRTKNSQNLFIKIMYLFLHVSTSVTFQVLSIWCNTSKEMCFGTAQNSFWTCQFWFLLVLLPFFAYSLPHWWKISLWGISSPGATEKNLSGQDWVNREGGAWGSCYFWLKTAEHSAWCGQVLSQITHHEIGKSIERVFKKLHWS